MKNWLKEYIKNRLSPWIISVVAPIVDEKLDQQLEIRFQLKEFEMSSEEERASYWEQQFNVAELVERFVKAGIDVEEQQIDRQDFETWMQKHPSLVACYKTMGNVRIEKLLEHYLTLTYLEVTPSDVLIDVAADESCFAPTLRQQGMFAYRQDLVYPSGIHGFDIGGDAGDMPVEDGFADVLTLHCAFECFQGDSDIRFIREVPRILRSHGRLGIVPLYIDTMHFVKTSPWCDKRNIQVEPEAKWLWRDDRYHEPFSRHYSPEVFRERIIRNLTQMQKKIVCFTNIHDLSHRYEGQQIYCHFMFKAEKL